MTAALTDAVVVVTRPREQAGELIAALEGAGARAIAAPGIAIQALTDAALDERARELVPQADWLVFISRNAVRHGTVALGGPGVVAPAHSRVAAVGPGTAAELRNEGWSVSAAPGTGGGDALLATPGFTAGPGDRVVIVRGEGGRERLAEGLRARGSVVDYLEVYRRCPAPAPMDALRSGWQSGGQRVTIVTSDSGVRALVSSLPAAALRELLGSRPVVISERLEAIVRELGFSRTPFRAAGTSTSELVAAAERAAVAETEETP